MTGSRGEVHDHGDGERTLVFRRVLPAPVDDVWAALTESDRLSRWFGSYTGTGGAGGTVELTVTGEVDAGGDVAEPVTVTVLECEPPRRLVVDVPEGPDRTWRVAVTLADDPDRAGAGGTVLLFEQPVPEGLDAADLEAGWCWYLDRMAAALTDQPMPAWDGYASAP